MKKVLIGLTVLSVVGFGVFVFLQKKKATQLSTDAVSDEKAPATSPASQSALPKSDDEVVKAIETGTTLLAQQIAEKIKSRQVLKDTKGSSFHTRLKAQDEFNNLNRQLLDLGFKYVDGKAVKL